MPNFNGRGAPGLELPAKALADMLASALRGGTKATLGLPGDIEGLGRMGLNFAGAGVDPEPALPNTEGWDKKLPPTNAMPGFDTVEKMGEFLPLPTGAGALMGGAKKAGSMVKALRALAEETPDLSRRGFLKDAGMGAGAAVAASVAPMAMVKALKGASELAPLTHSAPLAKAAPLAAKVAAHMWNPEALAVLLKNTAITNGEELASHMISKHTADEVAKHFANPQELKNADEWMEHWTDSPNPHDKWVEGFDAKAAGEAAKQDVIRKFVGSAEDLEDLKKALGSGHDGQIYVLGHSPEQAAVARQANAKHFPESAINPEYVAADKAEKFIDSLPISEIDKVIKTRAPGDVPPEWVAKGVTPEMIAYRTLPIRGSASSSHNLSSLEKVGEPLAGDLGMYEHGTYKQIPGQASEFIPAPKFTWNNATQKWDPE